MTTVFSIIVAAALANNLVLVQLLGVSSLFAFTRRLHGATELALFSGVVMVVSSVGSLLLHRLVLRPLNIQTLDLVLAVVISVLVSQYLGGLVKRYFPLTLRRHQLALTVVASNSAVIGLALLNAGNELSLGLALAGCLGASLGFVFTLLAFAALRQRLDLADVPAPFRGAPIYLISAGIIAMSMLSLAGST